VTRHAAGGAVVERRHRELPLRPPASFALDPFVPLGLPRVDVWFGFNPLACARGLVARRLGRAGRVVLWSVDFVPDRFGRRSPLTRLYDRVDRLCCERADARVELSEAARRARDERHGLVGGAPVVIVPMGAWLDRVPTVPEDAHAARRVVYLGHLVERQGVDVLLDAIERLPDTSLDVVGTGPDEPLLRRRAAALGGRARFHGFVEDHREVEQLLATASVAAAPYRGGETMTAYADPGKLKAYLAAGLPIVLTDVPPNARELEREAGATVVEPDAAALAAAIAAVLDDAARWRERRVAALAYVRRFDWDQLLRDALPRLGVGL
jgi:glycosyltransferase involved in cell wall biosynthesis